MALEIGSIAEGTVFRVLKMGALVRFPQGDVGLVHISEIAHSYVHEVEEYLHEGDVVRVKVTGVNDQGRYELSIKQLEPAPDRPGGPGSRDRRPPDSRKALDEKLADFTKRSQQRMSEVRRREGRRRGGRR